MSLAQRLRYRVWGAFALAGTLAALAASPAGAKTSAASAHARHQASSSVTLLESGSTLLYPLFNEWAPAFTRSHPGIRITTAATGSGTGISQAEKGAVQIGASDAYLPPSLQNGSVKLLNIPLAISAQAVNYNVPGLNNIHLRLSGPVLAGIYTGKIRYWNDPAIRALNPKVKLPHKPIVPVRRADSSGDTFLFTQYLTFSAGSRWPASFGTSISWPGLASEVAGTGNSGVVTALKQTPYSVGYVGVSYANEVAKDHLGVAMLENRSGSFLLPTAATIEAAAQARVAQTPKNESISLVYAPGKNSYPIINYEYAIVRTSQPSAAMATAIRTFLTWAITQGNAPSFLNPVHFRPLPPAVVRLSQAQIAQIR